MAEIEAKVYLRIRDMDILKREYWHICTHFNVLLSPKLASDDATLAQVSIQGHSASVFDALKYLSSLGLPGTKRSNINFPLQPWKFGLFVGPGGINLKTATDGLKTVRLMVPSREDAFENQTVVITGELSQVEKCYLRLYENISSGFGESQYIPPTAVVSSSRTAQEIDLNLEKQREEILKNLSKANRIMSAINNHQAPPIH